MLCNSYTRVDETGNAQFFRSVCCFTTWRRNKIFKMAQDRNILNILPRLVSKGLFNDSVSAMDVFDLDYFENRIQELQSAFFEDFITHTLAIKANPIKGY